MTEKNRLQPRTLSKQELAKRKKYLSATLLTCVALIMAVSVAHVVKLGANRMQDMRARATYDLKDEHLHIRAAGEDIALHEQHESRQLAQVRYHQIDIDTLLKPGEWQELGKMVLIPSGEFVMGTDLDRADEANKPAHKVTLPDYYIDKYLVTNAQYLRFVAASDHRPPLDWEHGQIPPGKALHPVTMVSWYDARAYCAWAGKRMPKEAEWEKAARGTDSRRWPWGNSMDVSRVNTYYNRGSTNEVTAIPSGASPYGLFDMAGNVSQWVEDDFLPYAGSSADNTIFFAKKTVANSAADRTMKVVDLEQTDVRFKVRRGGSWKSDPFSTSSYHRNFSLPHYASDFFGFRCAKD